MRILRSFWKKSPAEPEARRASTNVAPTHSRTEAMTASPPAERALGGADLVLSGGATGADRREVDAMPNDLITPENNSTKLLKEIFDNAYLETSLDGEGDLSVRDGGIKCWVYPTEDTIRLVAFLDSNHMSTNH